MIGIFGHSSGKSLYALLFRFVFIAVFLGISQNALAAPDTTPPTCGIWKLGGQTVSWQAWAQTGPQNLTLSNSTDGGSGIADAGGTCSAAANSTCTEQIRDNAGNIRNCVSPILRVDSVSPVCGTWSPGANPSAWSSAASITFTLGGSSDADSGLKSGLDLDCTTTNHLQTCTVTLEDNVGRTRTCTSPTSRFDRTAPVCSVWQMNSYPDDGGAYTTWNGNYDIISIPFTGKRKLIYAEGTDPSWIPGQWQSGMASGNEFHCDVENPAGSSLDLCLATIRDNAGNETDCGRGTGFLSPRVRVDRSLPPKPQVSCVLTDIPSSRYKCTISTATITGPSAAMLSWSRSTVSATSGFGGWILIGPVWYQINTTTSSVEITGTENLEFEMNITPGTTEWIRIQAVEMPDTPHERTMVGDGYRIDAPASPSPIPPISGSPAAQVDGTQVLTYGPDTNDWYTNGCGGSLSWPTLPEWAWTPSVTSKTYCSGDGDGRGYPTTLAAGNGGSISCMCFDDNPPVVDVATLNPAWTNTSIPITATVSNPTQNGAPFLGWTTMCNGTAGPSGLGTSISFSCSADSATEQVGTIQACDAASQCTTRTFKYNKETTKPTGDISISGNIRNHDGHASIAGSTSSQYTYDPEVRITVSNVADTGWSNLRTDPVQFSCSATPDLVSNWEAAPWAAFNFNLTTRPGCDASRGSRTIYMHVRDWAGNIHTTSGSIIFDDIKPTFDVLSNVLLKARENYTYEIQNPADTGGSAIRDFTITWEEGGVIRATYNNTDGTYKYDLWDIAKTVDADGKRNGEVKVTLEDAAWNFETKSMSFTLIAGDISLANSSVMITHSDPTGMVGDLVDEYRYDITLVDTMGNPVIPIPGFRHIETDWEMDNKSSFLWTASFSDGAIEYAWNTNDYVANDVPGYNRFQWVESTGDQFYFFKVRSAVPTIQGYPDYTSNTIRASKIHFINGLAGTCPASYTCTGPNINSSYDSNLGDDLVSKANGALSFKPALEVRLTKQSSDGAEWSTLTDGSWYPMQVIFVNNSDTQSFQTDGYNLDFRFSKELGPFADLKMRPGSGGWLGTIPSIAPSGVSGSIQVSFGSSVLPTVSPSPASSVVKNVELQVNSYGYWFGKFGFTAFLPYGGANNHAITLSNKKTGYNTQSMGITGISAFEQQVLWTAILETSFGSNESAGQRVSIIGSVADRGKNALATTAESAVSIDTAALDRQSIKANFQKNAIDMTRGLPARNSSTDCTPTLPTSLSDEVYYYDFRNLTNPSPVNGNAGCTLKISGVATAEGSGYKKLEISWVRTVIVLGGNIEIDTNIAYADNRSMLALLVLRNESDRTKGGNIYLRPNVTNVNAGAYAEGSLMSSNGTSVYSMENTAEGDLTKQLLWYGSLYSANTVGGAVSKNSDWECPFGSDSYMQTKTKSCSQEEASKYDFTFLRRFVLVNAASGPCSGKRTAKKIGTSYETFAISGEKSCFEDTSPGVSGLRTTQKTTPFVVEFDPFIQNSGSKAFSVSR